MSRHIGRAKLGTIPPTLTGSAYVHELCCVYTECKYTMFTLWDVAISLSPIHSSKQCIAQGGHIPGVNKVFS